MAGNQKPRGSVVRTPPDWFARYLMGGWGTTGPCAGNLTSIILFNNATDGSVLRVYGLNLAVGAATQLFFKSFPGSTGNLVTGVGAAAPIDPRTPAQPGQIYTLAQATPKGVGSGGVTIFPNTTLDLAPGYPLAIVPPQFSFSVESNVANIIVDAGFRWLSVYD